VSAPTKKVGNGRRAVPNSNNNLTDRPKYDDTLPSALCHLATDIAGAWEGKSTPHKRRRIALLLDELLSLIEADADVQQIFTRLPFALDKGLILQSFYSRVCPPPLEQPAEVVVAVNLKPHEQKVLQMMADGILDNNKIAQSLQISRHTVSTYRRSIHAKLDAHEELEAVAKGVRRGLVRFDAIKFVTNITRKKFNWEEHNPLFEGFLLLRYMKPDAHRETDRRMRLLHLFSVVLMIASYLALTISAPPACPDAAGAVCELSAEGEVVRCFNGEGALNYPAAIAVAPPQASQQGFAPGNLFVVDVCANPDLFNADRIVELDSDGNLLIGDRNNNRLLTFSPTGERLASFPCARLHRYFALTPDGKLYVTEYPTNALKVFDREGTLLKTVKVEPLQRLNGVAVGEDGKIWVCGRKGKEEEGGGRKGS
jgi:DNA-binding CsgD family transcriptional regulator